MISGERLRQAREIAGLTQGQLAEAVNLKQSHIALFEQNLRRPQEDTLKAIALAAGFPLAFFRREPGPEFPLGSLLYRRRKSMTSRDRDRVRQVGRLIFEVTEDLAQHFKRIDVRLPRISHGDPSDAAKITRTQLGLSPDAPVVNLIRRLEKNGVVVVAIPYDIEEHDAFSVWADTEPRTPVIVMTAEKPGDRQRWNIAHELGHLVMHCTYAKSVNQLEQDANGFASEFLLPEDVIRKDLTDPLTLTHLADLKSRWGVSMQALIMRAFQLGIITDGQRRYLFRQMAAKGWLRNEPVEIPPEKPRLLRKLAEAAYGPNFEMKTVAEPLGVPSHLLKHVMNAYASVRDLKRTEPNKSEQKNESGRLVTMLPRRLRISEGF